VKVVAREVKEGNAVKVVIEATAEVEVIDMVESHMVTETVATDLHVRTTPMHSHRMQ
jgi:hypothetical protein